MDKFNSQIKKAFSNINKSTEEVEKEQREERSLDYQRRQTITAEQALLEAERSNEIAEEALKESKKSNHKANIAIWISIGSVLAAIASTVIAAIALFK